MAAVTATRKSQLGYRKLLSGRVWGAMALVITVEFCFCTATVHDEGFVSSYLRAPICAVEYYN